MVRRVFTAVGDDGLSFIVHDEEASAVHELDGGRLVFHELWRTSGPEASNAGTTDSVTPQLEIMPEPGGTALRIVDLEPAQTGESVDLHGTPTTDYTVVLSGRVTAVGDEGEVSLGPGDVLVQRGGRHGWRNDGPEVCRFASVMIHDR